MRTLFIILCFILNNLICYGQTSDLKKYDTIKFSQIQFNNHSFFTKFSKIKKIIDDTKDKATVATGEDIDLPFIKLDEKELFYIIYSQGFNYVSKQNSNSNDDVYLIYARPNNKNHIKIANLTITRKLKLKKLKNYFPNSFNTAEKEYKTRNSKFFRLIIENNGNFGMCELEFSGNKFLGLYINNSFK